MALRIIEKNHRWGYIGCSSTSMGGATHTYNEGSSFPMHSNHGDSAWWANAILKYTQGSVNGNWLHMRFYSSWRGAWGSENTGYKVGWHVMSDGTMVLSSLPTGPITKSTLEWYGGYLFDSFPDDAKFTKDGEQYTVRLMKCGYFKRGGPGGGLVDGDEYSTYVLGSGEANTSTWGNWVTWSLDHEETSMYPDRGTGYCAAWNANSDLIGSSYRVSPAGNLSKNVETPTSSYLNSSTSESAVFRLIAIPDNKWADITGQTSYGIKTKGFDVTFNIEYPDGGYVVDFSVDVDGTTVTSAGSYQTGQHTVNIPDATVNGLKSGNHTVTVTCKNAARTHTTTLKASFTKADTYISVTGKACDREDMPKACKLVRQRVVGDGGSEAWFVTNNANDAEPVWEEYTGESHTFQNKEKTASMWAVSWRAEISGGTTQQSRLIKQVAMAVV